MKSLKPTLLYVVSQFFGILEFNHPCKIILKHCAHVRPIELSSFQQIGNIFKEIQIVRKFVEQVSLFLGELAFAFANQRKDL